MDELHGKFTTDILELIEHVALGLEVVAVLIILVGVIAAFVDAFITRSRHSATRAELYRRLRVGLGNTLLLGLEVLVAADVVRTIALEPTLENALILGLLVLIRTFLSWSLVVEMEGRWPWKGKSAETAEHMVNRIEA